MSKDVCNRERAKWVLSAFLREPKNNLDYMSLRREIDLSETPIRECLQYFEREGIFKVTNARGRRKGDAKFKLYSIAKEINILEKIYHDFYETSEEELLRSNYTHLIIRNYGFSEVYKIVESDLEQTDFRIIATRALLNQSATIEEYDKIADKIYKNIFDSLDQFSPRNTGSNSLQVLSYIRETIGKEFISSLNILSFFDPLQAIEFYRKTMHERIQKSIKKLAAESIITEGIESFMAFDTYLCPLTSYPINDVSQLILSPNPFQRIFEDAYLIETQIEKDAFKVLSGRAAAIYKFFADFLFEIFKYNHLELNDMVTLTKALIFHWNVASTRFDCICYYLAPEYGNERIGSGNYHLSCDGMRFQIFDLMRNDELLSEDIARNIIPFGSFPREFMEFEDLYELKYMDEPFALLRPCLVFKDMGWRCDYIPIADILGELESKLAEYDGRSA